jgi:hypothetical protein
MLFQMQKLRPTELFLFTGVFFSYFSVARWNSDVDKKSTTRGTFSYKELVIRRYTLYGCLI